MKEDIHYWEVKFLYAFYVFSEDCIVERRAYLILQLPYPCFKFFLIQNENTRSRMYRETENKCTVFRT